MAQNQKFLQKIFMKKKAESFFFHFKFFFIFIQRGRMLNKLFLPGLLWWEGRSSSPMDRPKYGPATANVDHSGSNVFSHYK